METQFSRGTCHCYARHLVTVMCNCCQLRHASRSTQIEGKITVLKGAYAIPCDFISIYFLEEHSLLLRIGIDEIRIPSSMKVVLERFQR